MSVGFPVPFQWHLVPTQSLAQGANIAPYLGYIEAALTGAGDLNLPHLSSPHLLTGCSLYIRNVSGYTATLTPYAGDTIDGAPSIPLYPGTVTHLITDPANNRWKIVCQCTFGSPSPPF